MEGAIIGAVRRLSRGGGSDALAVGRERGTGTGRGLQGDEFWAGARHTGTEADRVP
jgi:hypothetical protein